MNEKHPTVKVLHCADIHLDYSFTEIVPSPIVGKVRREGLIKNISRICEIAQARNVNVVTIAGDLFEETMVMPSTLTELTHQLARLAPIPVMIAPGKSDAFTRESLYSLWEFPENVHIFRTNVLSAYQL